MLGYFPDPHPGELFCSICARFSDVMHYPTNDGALRELFGVGSMRTLITLPVHLDHLVAILPPGADYTAEKFLYEHTLFPYYSSFLTAERQLRLRKAMLGAPGISTHVIAGNITPQQQWLRFCPACVEEDRRTFGESYWHRLHQVSGVEVCPSHQAFLQNSSARSNDPRHPCELTTAERAIHPSKLHPVDLSNATHQTLLKIARDTAWILDHASPSQGLEELHQRYQALLYEQGLATHRGVLQLRALAARIRERYSPELLERLYSPLGASNKFNWLISLLRASGNGQPPIRHLLLMDILGYSAEQFFLLSKESTPFGEGPWPCLNPCCEKYRQLVIQEFHEIGRREGKPTGLFACDCGFVYSRSGPDQTVDDRFRIGRIREYGAKWESTLRQRWPDETLTLKRLASQLGVTPVTAMHHAARLGLPFPRPRGRGTPQEARIKQLFQKHKEEVETMRVRYRKAWTAAIKEHPKWGKSLLQKKLPTAYSWLLRNDRAWLKVHPLPQPSKRKGGRRVSLEYWQQQDAILVEKVGVAVDRLRNAPGNPIRITLYALGAAMNISLRPEKLARLPLTAKLISEVSETRVAFALRRIRLITEQAQREGRQLSSTRLVNSIGMDLINKSPEVKQAIDSALAREEPISFS